MFWAISGFGEVCVSALDARILIAVAKLLGEAEVPVVVVLFGFRRTLGAIGIIFRNLSHSEPPVRLERGPRYASVTNP